MNPIDQRIAAVRSRGGKLFVPFLTAGDPDLELTGRLVGELARRGASLIELGVPYSDPIADGPVIQASYTRALQRGIRLADILAAVRSWGQSRVAASGPASEPSAPLVLMVSYSIVFRHGPEQFVAAAQEAGIAGAIVPDLPADEAGPMAELAAGNDFKLIQLVTPTTPPQRAAQIAQLCTGFLYFVSVTGITGERERLPEQVLERVRWLKEQTDLPVCVGFGVSRPEQVQRLCQAADGVIVGSAIVRRIAEWAGRPAEEMVSEVGKYVACLVAALPERAGTQT